MNGSEPTARSMWRLLEPLHAVTYFAPETADAFRSAGTKGFWMGYFGGRAAPMGEAIAPVVAATFFNFSPAMVARSVPDVWSFATPAQLLEARSTGATRALCRLLGPLADSPQLSAAAAMARRAVDGLVTAGRPLAAANASLPWPADEVAVLWQAATVLREHRGDGHVAALVVEGLDGCQAHVSLAATGAVPRTVLQPNRGWTDQQWDDAERNLAQRGWLDRYGRATDEGMAGRAAVEAATDLLASDPWEQLGAADTTALAQALTPLTRAVLASGVIPEVNPMGLPTEL
ncbi:MAG: SCO6745 family protein [Acidimicrobiales bacterium]